MAKRIFKLYHNTTKATALITYESERCGSVFINRCLKIEVANAGTYLDISGLFGDMHVTDLPSVMYNAIEVDAARQWYIVDNHSRVFLNPAIL